MSAGKMKSTTGIENRAGRTRLRAIVVATLLVAVAVARGAETECQKNEKNGFEGGAIASAVIPQLALCYGAAEEEHPLTVEIRSLVAKTSPSGNLPLALRKLADQVQGDPLYGAQKNRDDFALIARRAAVDVERGVGPGNGAAAMTIWHVNETGTNGAMGSINIIDILDRSCPAAADMSKEPCVVALNEAKGWLRVFQLTEWTLTRYSAAVLEALLERSTLRLAMWHAYRDEALPQFPWEWGINSWRLNSEDKGRNGRPRDAQGQPIGPMAPPTDQIIFLHPGVGLEYRRKPDKNAADDKSRTAPIIYMEVVGRYSWSWNEKTGAMLGGSGLSLVTTYADRGADTKFGVGLLFHGGGSKKYTLGVTRSGDTTNVILNADLAGFLKEWLPYWKKAGQMATK